MRQNRLSNRDTESNSFVVSPLNNYQKPTPAHFSETASAVPRMEYPPREPNLSYRNVRKSSLSKKPPMAQSQNVDTNDYVTEKIYKNLKRGQDNLNLVAPVYY
jgi:hypothetical protein